MFNIKSEADWADAPGFCRESLGLKTIRLETWGGWVWVSMDPEIEPLLDYLAPVPQLYENFEFENTRVTWFKTVVARCNWKTAMDAFNEAYHVEGTHSQLNRWGIGKQVVPGIPAGRHASLKVQRNDTSRSSGYLNQDRVDLRKHMSSLGAELNTTLHALYTDHFVNAADRLLEELPESASADEVMAAFKRFHREEMEKTGARWPDKLTEEEVAEAGGSYIIFPNTMLLASYDGALWYRMRPNGDDPDSCIFDIWWLGRYPEGGEPPFRHETFATEEEFKGQNFFLEQDFGNMASVQKGMKSRGFSGGRTNPLQERAVSHLHDVLYDYLFDDGRPWRA